MARIADLLREGPTYSVEFPPPKSDAMLRQFEKTLREIEPLRPSFCSVTYGAGGSTKEGTLEAVLHIHRDTDLPVMPHLTCAGQRRQEVVGLVERYRDEGIENLLALAGDPPREGGAAGDFHYAVELIEVARDMADFSIGVAAFPEVHPRSPDRKTDRRRLAEKLEIADFAITQFFWEAEHYFRLCEEMDDLGSTTPIIPSLFPVINVGTAQSFTTINGAEWPTWLQDRFDLAGADKESVRQVGVEVACEIGRELLDAGVPGLHVYTMNQAASVQEIWANLGLPSQ